ncbi:MAG: hypothetical protein KF777_03425 [Planctomycetaceae bacterium]|nr:hypothetical protein [Planctomycetaceae bacterium]
MQRIIPMLLTSIVGVIAIASYFVPVAQPFQDRVEEWFLIVAAIAMVLGAASLLLHHLKAISNQEAGWGYSAVTVAALVITTTVGLLKLGAPPDLKHPELAWSGSYLAEGGGAWWIYTYVMSPIVATMFSLLAFYVASAAFRAFRARNFEAMLLLGTALIVLLGRTSDGTWLTSGVPADYPLATIPGLNVLIMSVFNTAGQRAIMIGIALGVAATSLRILLGLDRSYLGGD